MRTGKVSYSFSDTLVVQIVNAITSRSVQKASLVLYMLLCSFSSCIPVALPGNLSVEVRNCFWNTFFLFEFISVHG